MVGEHGDSSVAIWSTVSVAGMPVLNSLQESHSSFDEEAMEGIRRPVVNSAYEVINLKGYTSWPPSSAISAASTRSRSSPPTSTA